MPAMLSRFMLLLLTLAVFWTQSVIAQHRADHLLHDVNEVCQVLANADHSKFLNTPPLILPRDFGPVVYPGMPGMQFASHTNISHCARSPPLQ